MKNKDTEDYIHPIIRLQVRDADPSHRKISYSQYAMYAKCPKSWELAYARNLRTFNQSIHLVFGTSMHTVIQTYLTTMYNDTVKAADALPVNDMLRDEMVKVYKNAVEQTGDHFSNKFEMDEFYQDGVAILDWIKRHRAKYFSAKNEELLGIEIPLYEQATGDHPAVIMIGYLDIVIRDKRTDRVKIIDIKTSTGGWNKYQKADKLKASQLVLYKEYFGEQYGYDKDKIDILYFIVKRKLIDGAMFPQRRIQEFIPASGKPTRNKLKKSVDDWAKACFDENGDYILNREYPPVGGKGLKNCKYCEFKDREDLCPKDKRIRE